MQLTLLDPFGLRGTKNLSQALHIGISERGRGADMSTRLQYGRSVAMFIAD
jgi:hypothetical protein